MSEPPRSLSRPSLDDRRFAASEYGMFEPGATVGGLYRVEAKVGEGAFGEVWSGVTIATEQRVALKRLHTSVAANVESIQRFRREADLLSRVNSDYVAKLINFLPDPNHGLVLVLEFIDGAPLSELFGVQTISVELAINIGIDMLFALRDLHAAHIIHRDIKPANVIMRPLPNGDSQAVLCDFSMSRLAGRARNTWTPAGPVRSVTPSLTPSLTPSNTTLGTLQYMSPEQILSSRDVSERTDLYAVGAVLYRGVAGTYVFDEVDGPQSIARVKLMNEAPLLDTGRTDRVAREFAEVIARALRRRPQDRYASASEMLDAFLHLHELAAEAFEIETSIMAEHGLALASDASPAAEPAPSAASEEPAPPSTPGAAEPTAGAPPLEPARLPTPGARKKSPRRRISLVMFVISLLIVFALGIWAGQLFQSGPEQNGNLPRTPILDPPK